MDSKMKIVLVAVVHGAQFVCPHCRKVFISEKYLRDHESRRHSLGIQPTQRIWHQVELLDSSRTEVGEPGGRKLEGNGVKCYTKSVKDDIQESPRSRLSRLMNETMNPFGTAGIGSAITSSEPASPKKADPEPTECLVNGVTKDPVYTGVTAKTDTPFVRTVQTSETISDKQLFKENLNSAVWKLADSTEQHSIAELTQLDGDDLSLRFSVRRPFRSKLLGPVESEDLFMFEGTSDSWLFREDSGSENTSTSSVDFDVARRSATSLVGDSVEDLKMPSWEEIEEEVLNENTGNTEVIMNLEAQLMGLGIDPNSAGIPDKLMEKSRLTLHERRARMMKENKNFKDMLDDLRSVTHDRAMQIISEC